MINNKAYRVILTIVILTAVLSCIISCDKQATDSDQKAEVETPPYSIENVTVSADGNEHSLTVSGLTGIETVYYALIPDGPWYEDNFAFSEVGKYTVFAKIVTSEYEVIVSGMLTITGEEDNEPTVPDEPTEPEEPTIPDEPTEPEEPTIPDEPTEPEEPTVPDEPTEPDEPTIPDEPTEPDEPTIPDEPTEPDEPTIPDEPTEPDEPTIPDEPTDPDEPIVPDEPTDPDEPTEPDVDPTEPDKEPAEPDKEPITPSITYGIFVFDDKFIYIAEDEILLGYSIHTYTIEGDSFVLDNDVEIQINENSVVFNGNQYSHDVDARIMRFHIYTGEETEIGYVLANANDNFVIDIYYNYDFDYDYDYYECTLTFQSPLYSENNVTHTIVIANRAPEMEIFNVFINDYIAIGEVGFGDNTQYIIPSGDIAQHDSIIDVNLYK